MQLTDSALPTGAFSHSLGFESYIEAGIIHDEASFAAWVHMFCTQQLTFTDALAIRLVTPACRISWGSAWAVSAASIRVTSAKSVAA